MNFYCHFCDKRCHLSCPEFGDWWCKDCNVVFREGGYMFGLSMMRFTYTNPDESYYSLTIDFLNKTTFLCKYRGPKKDDEPWEAYDHLPKSKVISLIPHAMQGVNPDNLWNKIQTILVFS